MGDHCRIYSQASVRATAVDLIKMRKCLEKASAASDIPEFEVWDSELHGTIISAAKMIF